MSITKVNKSKTVSPLKVDKVYTDIVNILAKNKLTVQELLLVLSNTLYTVGASIGGYKDKGPSVEEIDRMYALKPSLDLAIMLQGLTIGTYINDLDKKYEELVEEAKSGSGKEDTTAKIKKPKK
jgi:hypothetical protein